PARKRRARPHPLPRPLARVLLHLPVLRVLRRRPAVPLLLLGRRRAEAALPLHLRSLLPGGLGPAAARPARGCGARVPPLARGGWRARRRPLLAGLGRAVARAARRRRGGVGRARRGGRLGALAGQHARRAALARHLPRYARGAADARPGDPLRDRPARAPRCARRAAARAPTQIRDARAQGRDLPQSRGLAVAPRADRSPPRHATRGAGAARAGGAAEPEAGAGLRPGRDARAPRARRGGAAGGDGGGVLITVA